LEEEERGDEAEDERFRWRLTGISLAVSRGPVPPLPHSIPMAFICAGFFLCFAGLLWLPFSGRFKPGMSDDFRL
jgi:hypothetical protein